MLYVYMYMCMHAACIIHVPTCRLKASQKKVEELEKENKKLKGNMSAISADLKSKTKENSKLTAKMEETAKDHNEVRIICT